MSKRLQEGAAPGSLFECSNNGWINQQLFLSFLASIPPAQPVLMIEDVTSDMIKLARENDVHLLCLPAHTTHILQPLEGGGGYLSH